MHFPNLFLVTCLIASTAALDPVEVYGSKFFKTDGSQFFIKGVAYQLSPQDGLTNSDQCRQDGQLMKQLGANTVRVYHVDAGANHDDCMKALDEAGIYLLIDLDTWGTYIEPGDLHWNSTQYEKFCQVMDAFQGYNNVLGFFVGNENIARRDDSPVAPFLKAAARDMKAYRDAKGYRKIPVGYSAADIKELRPMLQDYLTCGGNSSEIVDFFGLNSYSWCDPSTYEGSTYDQLEEYAAKFPVPIIFTETGCNVPGPRLWEDQDAIFGEDMVDDWSGSIIYEWLQEQNNYGIVSYGAPVEAAGQSGGAAFNDFSRRGSPTPRNPDFENLKAKWASNQPTGVRKADYNTATISTRRCPASTAGGWWQVDGNVELPRLGSAEQTVRLTATRLTSTGAPSRVSESEEAGSTGQTATGTTARSTATDEVAKPTASGENDDESRAAHGDGQGSTAGARWALATLLIVMLL